jgi:hypothetical protein
MPNRQVRPGWMTALAVFCAATVLFLVPRDLFLAETRDVEVWFGFELHGAAAQLTAPLHWLIFASGAWAAWQGRRWVAPCAAGYLFYVGASHVVWSEASSHGDGWRIGLVHGVLISIPGLWLLYAWRGDERA